MKKHLYLFTLSLLFLCAQWSFAQNASADYCLSKGTRSNLWINKISIGTWAYQSGNNNGYLQKPAVDLVLKSVTPYSLQLELGGIPRIQDSMYWQIWVDANGDGDFEDEQERVFQAKSLQRAQPKGNIQLPYGAVGGQRRLRLMLSKTGFASPCEQSAKVLEVEDYDFSLEEGEATCTAIAPQNIRIDAITDSSARIIIKRPASLAYHLKVRDERGTVVYHTQYLLQDTILIHDLRVRTTYQVTVQLQCYPDVFSPWSEAAFFSTPTPICDTPKRENIEINALGASRYSFSTNLLASFYNWRFRLAGEQAWTTVGSTNATLQLPLDYDNREVEVQLSITCKGVVQSEWSPGKTFRTAEFCAEPKFDSIKVERDFGFKKTRFSYTIPWSLSHWRLRALGDTSWMEFTTHQATLLVDTLLEESFEVQMRLECKNGQLSAWSKSIVLRASNCPQLNPDEPRHFEYFFAGYPAFQIRWISSAPSVKSEATYQWFFREKGEEEWSIPQLSRVPTTVLRGMTPGKTYEIKMEVTCALDSLNAFSVIETKVLPLSCVEIDESLIKVYQQGIGELNITVEIEESVPFQMLFAQKGSTEYDTLIGLGWWSKYFNKLPADTEYEVRVRGYCFDGTEIPWSTPFYFKTWSCELPTYGKIDIKYFEPLDSIVFDASFTDTRNQVDTTSLTYHWQYRKRDSDQWVKTALHKSYFKRFVLRELEPNTNYELRQVTHCLQNPIDTFALSIYFSTDPDQCGSKPDTSMLMINRTPWPVVSDPWFTCKIPDTYSWGARILERRGNEWVISPSRVYLQIPPSFKVYVPEGMAFQFRINCPNGNIGPWSEIIFPGDFEQFVEPISLSKGFVLKEKLVIAPNPGNGRFNILLPMQSPTEQTAYLEVYNMAGQKIRSQIQALVEKGSIQLDLGNQNSGIYLLRIKIGQQVYTDRLLLHSDR